MAAREKVECDDPAVLGIVTPSRIRPTAVMARPHHCRLPTSKPKIRSAITAMRTTPPLSTTCTTDSGANEIAATCSSQPPPPTAMPIANHFEHHSPRAVRSGWRMSTGGASHAPRCLKKNPRFERNAQASARRMPI
jgi:hypothetical protein